MPKLILDDLTWHSGDLSSDQLVEGLIELSERFDEVRDHGLPIYCFDGLYETERVNTHTLAELLHEDESKLPASVRRRLALGLDKLKSIPDQEIECLEVSMGQAKFLAPAVGWGCAVSLRHGQATCCLTPQFSGRSGLLNCQAHEQINAKSDLYFARERHDLDEFFRHAIRFEKVQQSEFKNWAKLAFSNLCFVDGVFNGIGDLSRNFESIRDDLMYHLAILNDFGQEIFSQKQNRLIEYGFSAHGITISPENFQTRKDTHCRAARERDFAGKPLFFEWHTKIELHRDRIHVHPGTEESGNRVIIGIIHEHLPIKS